MRRVPNTTSTPEPHHGVRHRPVIPSRRADKIRRNANKISRNANKIRRNAVSGKGLFGVVSDIRHPKNPAPHAASDIVALPSLFSLFFALFPRQQRRRRPCL